MSQAGKVRVKVPKVRRNMGEVRSYHDLPNPRQRTDQFLLWGTVVGLFGAVLCGGFSMWSWGRDTLPMAPASPQAQRLDAPGLLAEARQNFIDGHFAEANRVGRMALALELANPSDPPLEREIRRNLALSLQNQGDYGNALKEWDWLVRHGHDAQDRSQRERCLRELTLASEKRALEQLREAQKALSDGQTQQALTQARQAVNLLEAQPSDPRSRQAAHLLVANIALQQGLARVAWDEMRQAQSLGSLGEEQQRLLEQLRPRPVKPGAQPVAPARVNRSMQVRVVIPSLGDSSRYPQRTAVTRRPTNSPGPGEPPQPTPDSGPEVASQPRQRGPKVELPRLQMPDQGAPGRTMPDGSLPSYQDRSGTALPAYNTQTRRNDSLPGY